MPRALRVAFASGAALSGCAARSPSIPILGAYFPAWMVCILVGVVLAALVRVAFGLARIDVGPRPLVYPALAVAFAIVTWLVLYRG
jgi:urea transporter